MSEILLSNMIRYLGLSNIILYFSSKFNNPGYLVLSCFLLNLRTLSQIKRKSFAPYGACKTS